MNEHTETPAGDSGGGKWVYVVSLLGLAFILLVARFKYATPTSEAAKVATQKAAPAPVVTETVEALVLMYEGVTPCSTDIQYRAKIRTDGYPLRIKFQGVTEWFDHPGKGAVEGPAGVQVGETKFESTDKEHPNVRVWVYKKIIIQK